jgi:exodeoxyribonuclease-5
MNVFKHLHFSHPTTEQNNVLKAMVDFISAENQYNFMVLCGASDTGKTSITAALIGYLNELGKQYKISAPTGRAARILGRKAKTTTSTIHSMIYAPKSDNETGKVTFKLKIGHNANPTVYIIYKASMISKDINKDQNLFQVEKGLIYDLIPYIKKSNVNNKIIFPGDRYQLPPIDEAESYALNKEFLERTFNLKGHSYLLTELKRQEDGSYILENRYVGALRLTYGHAITCNKTQGGEWKKVFVNTMGIPS